MSFTVLPMVTVAHDEPHESVVPSDGCACTALASFASPQLVEELPLLGSPAKEAIHWYRPAAVGMNALAPVVGTDAV